MKYHLSILAISLLLAAPAFADWVIESKIESPQINSNMVTKIKGDKIRADMTGPMGAMSSIIDTTSGDSTQLIHAQKMAMKISAAQLKQTAEMAKQMAGLTGKASTTAKLQATGQKEKVGGYDCEIWSYDDGALKAKYWVAKSHPQAAALKDMEKKMRASMATMQMGPDTSVLPGPAIKTETTAAGITSTMTVTSVKEQTLAASDFEVPSDYQSMAMPGLPAGLPTK
jgi:hypothetical protein